MWETLKAKSNKIGFWNVENRKAELYAVVTAAAAFYARLLQDRLFKAGTTVRTMKAIT